MGVGKFYVEAEVTSESSAVLKVEVDLGSGHFYAVKNPVFVDGVLVTDETMAEQLRSGLDWKG